MSSKSAKGDCDECVTAIIFYWAAIDANAPKVTVGVGSSEKWEDVSVKYGAEWTMQVKKEIASVWVRAEFKICTDDTKSSSASIHKSRFVGIKSTRSRSYQQWSFSGNYSYTVSETWNNYFTLN